MAFAGKRMELRITVLNEISQTQEDKYVFSHRGISLGFASSIFLPQLPAQSHGQLSVTLVSLTPPELMGYVNVFPEHATLRLPAGYAPSFIDLPGISYCKPQLGPASPGYGARGCLIPLQSVHLPSPTFRTQLTRVLPLRLTQHTHEPGSPSFQPLAPAVAEEERVKPGPQELKRSMCVCYQGKGSEKAGVQARPGTYGSLT